MMGMRLIRRRSLLCGRLRRRNCGMHSQEWLCHGRKKAERAFSSGAEFPFVISFMSDLRSDLLKIKKRLERMVAARNGCASSVRLQVSGAQPTLAVLTRPSEAKRRTMRGGGLEEAGDVFAHLVFPIGPVVAALGAPVVEGVADAFAAEDFGEAVGGAGFFPGAGAGGDVDVAGG
jgi:hypothetical protein